MSAIQTIAPKVWTLPGIAAQAVDAAAIGTGMAFLVGELEKLDPTLNEPLQSVTWQRDIFAVTGGGYVEHTSNLFVDYATTGGNENGIIGGETTDIPVMQADISKDVWKVFPFANILKVPFLDQQKLQTIGRSLQDILNNGIQLNYNKSLDNVVYVGVPSLGVYGLTNHPQVIASAAPAGANSSTQWKQKTPDEILADVNQLITNTWTNSEFASDGMANHILVPPVQYAWLAGQKVSSAGNMSILQFLLENNIARNQGVDLFIAPSRWCVGAGAGGTDRMVAYVNNKNKLHFNIPVPLTRVMTETSVQQMSYLTGYVAQIGEVKFLYLQCAQYMDGI